MKHTLLLIILQLASAGADGYYTHENMMRPRFTEHNPLAAPFTHGTKEFVSTSLLATGGTIYSELWLRKHGHAKFAEALALSNAGSHTFGATYSATHLEPIVPGCTKSAPTVTGSFTYSCN